MEPCEQGKSTRSQSGKETLAFILAVSAACVDTLLQFVTLNGKYHYMQNPT